MGKICSKPKKKEAPSKGKNVALELKQVGFEDQAANRPPMALSPEPATPARQRGNVYSNASPAIDPTRASHTPRKSTPSLGTDERKIHHERATSRGSAPGPLPGPNDISRPLGGDSYADSIPGAQRPMTLQTSERERATRPPEDDTPRGESKAPPVPDTPTSNKGKGDADYESNPIKIELAASDVHPPSVLRASTRDKLADVASAESDNDELASAEQVAISLAGINTIQRALAEEHDLDESRAHENFGQGRKGQLMRAEWLALEHRRLRAEADRLASIAEALKTESEKIRSRRLRAVEAEQRANDTMEIKERWEQYEKEDVDRQINEVASARVRAESVAAMGLTSARSSAPSSPRGVVSRRGDQSPPEAASLVSEKPKQEEPKHVDISIVSRRAATEIRARRDEEEAEGRSPISVKRIAVPKRTPRKSPDHANHSLATNHSTVSRRGRDGRPQPMGRVTPPERGPHGFKFLRRGGEVRKAQDEKVDASGNGDALRPSSVSPAKRRRDDTHHQHAHYRTAPPKQDGPYYTQTDLSSVRRRMFPETASGASSRPPPLKSKRDATGQGAPPTVGVSLRHQSRHNVHDHAHGHYRKVPPSSHQAATGSSGPPRLAGPTG